MVSIVAIFVPEAADALSYRVKTFDEAPFVLIVIEWRKPTLADTIVVVLVEIFLNLQLERLVGQEATGWARAGIGKRSRSERISFFIVFLNRL